MTARSSRRAAIFCTTPNGGDGGVWQAGKGLTADATGNIYFSIGNGTFDAEHRRLGLRHVLHEAQPDAASVLDWFAPFDEQSQSNARLGPRQHRGCRYPRHDRLCSAAGQSSARRFCWTRPISASSRRTARTKCWTALNGVSGNDQVGQNPICLGQRHLQICLSVAWRPAVEQFRYDPSVGNFNPKGILPAGGSG